MTAKQIYEEIVYGALESKGIKLIEEYARLQIEKDRERVKSNIRKKAIDEGLAITVVTLFDIINNVSINLD